MVPVFANLTLVWMRSCCEDAWGDYPCCPGLDKATAFCPPAACPIMSAVTKEPAVPFWAKIVGGKCQCDAPWTCDE